DPVEDLADDVEARDEVWTDVPDKETNDLAHVDRPVAEGSEGAVAHYRTGPAVEDDEGRLLEPPVVRGIGEVAALLQHLELLPAPPVRVELALHEIELVVDRVETLRGLNDDQAVHAVRDVHGDVGEGAVVDKDAGVA